MATEGKKGSEGEWQPIATAPKDGTPILIWQPDRTCGGRHQCTRMPDEVIAQGVGCYRNDDPRLMVYDDLRYAIGYWRPGGGWGNRNSATVNPTHWQPLPPRPKPLTDMKAKAIEIEPVSKWGKRPLYAAKIGTHGSALVLVKRVRKFYVGQQIKYADSNSLRGMCVGCMPNWQNGRIWLIEDNRLFITRN